MSDAEPSTRVGDDELILRRIPISTAWYNENADSVSRLAFKPTKSDTTGLSVSRAKSESHPDFLTSAEDAASGRNSSGYYVAVLRVGDLRSHGIDVVAKPQPGNPGHAEIPMLTYDARKSSEAVNATSLMAEKLAIRVEGPFVPASTSDLNHNE